MRTAALTALLLATALGASACDQVGSGQSDVPGAAATAARSAATPIPTPIRAETAAPSPLAVRPSPGASPLPSPSAVSSEVEAERVRQVLAELLRSPELPGIERYLLDTVSFASSEGGQVWERAQAAAWLRERATGAVRIVAVQRSALAILLEVQTEGWESLPPVAEGRISFNLHRYGRDGRQDDLNGEWQIDVIAAD